MSPSLFSTLWVMKALWRASICTAATFDIQLHAGEGKETPVCAGDTDESKTISLSSLPSAIGIRRAGKMPNSWIAEGKCIYVNRCLYLNRSHCRVNTKERLRICWLRHSHSFSNVFMRICILDHQTIQTVWLKLFVLSLREFSRRVKTLCLVNSSQTAST